LAKTTAYESSGSGGEGLGFTAGWNAGWVTVTDWSICCANHRTMGSGSSRYRVKTQLPEIVLVNSSPVSS
jgi:hypothetical protein